MMTVLRDRVRQDFMEKTFTPPKNVNKMYVSLSDFVPFTIHFKPSPWLFALFPFSLWRSFARLLPHSLPPLTSRGRQTSSLESLARACQTLWTGGTKGW